MKTSFLASLVGVGSRMQQPRPSSRASDCGDAVCGWSSSRTARCCRQRRSMVADINPTASGLEPRRARGDRLDDLLHRGRRRSTGGSCGRATAPPPAPSWSRTSTPAAAALTPVSLTNVNGTLFFAANDGTHGDELWKSDGTAAGTVLVKDINPGGDRLRTPVDLDERQRHAVLRGRRRRTRLRAVEERRHGRRHRPGQGHQPRQRTARSLGPDERQRRRCSSRPTTATHGHELWKSDGTAAGTVTGQGHLPGLLRALRRSSQQFDPSDLTNVNGTLFFTANDGTHGDELWKSDGTAAGTVLVKDINPGIAATGSYPYSSYPST